MDDQEKAIKELINKAAKVASADEAMKLSQAACNAANALCAMFTASKMAKGGE